MILVNAGMYAMPPSENLWSPKNFSSVRPADIVVVLTVSPEESFRRMENRPRGRPQRMRSLADKEQLEVITRACHFAKKSSDLADTRITQKIEIDATSASAEKIANTVFQELISNRC